MVAISILIKSNLYNWKHTIYSAKGKDIKVYRYNGDGNPWASKYEIMIVTSRFKNGKIKQTESMSIKDDYEMNEIIKVLIQARDGINVKEQHTDRLSDLDHST